MILILASFLRISPAPAPSQGFRVGYGSRSDFAEKLFQFLRNACVGLILRQTLKYSGIISPVKHEKTPTGGGMQRATHPHCGRSPPSITSATSSTLDLAASLLTDTTATPTGSSPIVGAPGRGRLGRAWTTPGWSGPPRLHHRLPAPHSPDARLARCTRARSPCATHSPVPPPSARTVSSQSG